MGGVCATGLSEHASLFFNESIQNNKVFEIAIPKVVREEMRISILSFSALAMRCAFLIVVVSIVTIAHACCYTLSSVPRGATIPVFTWTLNLAATRPVPPTACMNTLVAADHSTAPKNCRLLGVAFKPMGIETADWTDANLTLAQRVVFTQPCIGVGPYTAGASASWVLLHQLSDAWVRLRMQCDDSAYESCVRFGLKLRDGGESKLDSAEVTDPEPTGQCVRTPSPTPSPTPVPTLTPTTEATPSPTALPFYGTVSRVEVDFETGVSLIMQFGLNYNELKTSEGARGAYFCSAPVLDSSRQLLVETLFPSDDDNTTAAARRTARNQKLKDQLHAYQLAQSRIQVTVVWRGGGWCRVQVDMENTVQFVGCRLFVGADVHERVASSTVYALDSRAVPLCGVAVSVNYPTPSPTQAPVQCTPEQYVVDSAHALVVLSNETHYAEVIVRQVQCGDAVRRPRVHRASQLVGYATALDRERAVHECAVADGDSRQLVMCADGTRLFAVTDGCTSITSDLRVARRCESDARTVLLL